MAMITARILPIGADEETLDTAIARSAREGLVPCVPRRFRLQRPFRITFLAPDAIPASWRRMIVRVVGVGDDLV